MTQFRIKIYTGPLKSGETYYTNLLISNGFIEVYQGTEYVYGSIQREDDDIMGAQVFARRVLGPRFTNRDVKIIGAFEV